MFSRVLPLILFAFIIGGCDSVSTDNSVPAANVDFLVTAVDGAATADIILGSDVHSDAALPFSERMTISEGESYEISAATNQGLVEVTVAINGTTRSIERAQSVVLRGVVKSGELEIEGPIDEITDESITVRGFTFAITSRTEFEGASDDSTSSTSFAEGDRVEVDGYLSLEGGLIADEVEAEGPEDRFDEAEAEGVIEDMGDGFIQVQSAIFQISPQTEFDDVSFDQLTIGDFIEIEGEFMSEDNTITAVEVELEMDDDDDDDDSDDDDSDDDDSDDDDSDDD